MVERTPKEWRDVLYPALLKRRPLHKLLRDYYSGEHALPTAPSTATDTYMRLAELGVTNMCGLVVDSVNERLRPQGVRLSTSSKSDLAMWQSVWQANNLDADWSVAQEEALKVGRGPVLIWPRDPDNLAAGCDVTIEDPDEVIVAYAPGSRRERVAALKTYVDDDTEHVTVWTKDEVRAWTRHRLNGVFPLELIMPTTTSLGGANWDNDPDNTGINPFGRVPVVELRSKPNVNGIPQPELSTAVLRIQDSINKTMFDVTMAGEAGAFPQRYGIGIQNDIDPVTKLPINPLTVGPNRVWILRRASDGEPVQVGQLDAFPVDGLLAVCDARIKHLASISQTPVYYLLSGLTNVGADSIRAAETGHVAKILKHQVQFGEAAEEMFRLALIARGRRPVDDIEMEWAAPETRSPAELADAAIKLSQSGYPFLAIARYMGATQSEIDRLVEQRAQEAAAIPPVLAPPSASTVPEFL